MGCTTIANPHRFDNTPNPINQKAPPDTMSQSAAIFDLDGTLIDSLQDIYNSMNHALAQHQLPPHSPTTYKQFIGEGLHVLAERATPQEQHHQLESIIETFRPYYQEHCADHTRPYDGITDMLHQLAQNNIHLAVLSNKPHAATLKVVEQYFPDTNFTVVSGQKENVPRKPHPAGAIHIAETLNLPPANCYFIGDTMYDMQTATRADMIPVGVTWGFREKEELIEHGAQHLIDTPAELIKLITAN